MGPSRHATATTEAYSRLMLSVDQVTVRLNEAEAAIRDGQVGNNPRKFLKTLRTQMLKQSPPEVAIAVNARLRELSNLLGVQLQR